MYRVAIFISKLHYIYRKCNIYVQNCDMYIHIRRPVFILYITVKWFYIFQYSFDINISQTFLDIYFMRSVFHVSLHDLSRISRAWRWGRHVSRRLCKTAIWWRKRGEFSGLFERSLARKPANQTYPQMYRFIKATERQRGGFQNVKWRAAMQVSDSNFRDVFPPTGSVNLLSPRCSLLTQKGKLLSSKLLPVLIHHSIMVEEWTGEDHVARELFLTHMESRGIHHVPSPVPAVRSGRRGGLMVSAFVPGTSGPGSSPGQGHCVVFLGKTLNSHSASLHPGV